MFRTITTLWTRRDASARRGTCTAIHILFCSVLLILSSHGGLAHAQEPSSTASRSFAITPQPLSFALLQFSEATNIEVLFDATIARDIQTQGVSGDYAPEDALRMLLHDTGLSYRTTSAGSVTLEQAAVLPIVSAPVVQNPSVEPMPQAAPRPLAQKSVKVPEIVVKDIQERDNDTQTYVAEESTTATRTDTPIRDVPQSIQVITRKVIEEQRTFRLQNTLENVSGINATESAASLYDSLIIRGFSATDRSYFRNGLLDPFAQFTASDTYNIRRLEVLKGP
ncbi:MAG: TonB-dependent receptor plug domain-containing protein, partial [Nitrospira sp.]|nr:TonB-dependent receptor plug domain-containing protein [Nitrospira sp.]